jgi:hypothetical protein
VILPLFFASHCSQSLNALNCFSAQSLTLILDFGPVQSLLHRPHHRRNSLEMTQRDWYTNIMLDLECASVEAYNPVLIELGAVQFDIDTGEELGHYTSIISYQSCLDHGLVHDIVDGKDGETTKFLKRDPILKQTLLESKASEIPLERVLSEFTKFVNESCQRTLRSLERRSPPRKYTQPMIWGNGAVADNVYVYSQMHSLQFSDCPRTFKPVFSFERLTSYGIFPSFFVSSLPPDIQIFQMLGKPGQLITSFQLDHQCLQIL